MKQLRGLLSSLFLSHTAPDIHTPHFPQHCADTFKCLLAQSKQCNSKRCRACCVLTTKRTPTQPSHAVVICKQWWKLKPKLSSCTVSVQRRGAPSSPLHYAGHTCGEWDTQQAGSPPGATAWGSTELQSDTAKLWLGSQSPYGVRKKGEEKIFSLLCASEHRKLQAITLRFLPCPQYLQPLELKHCCA